MNLLPGGDIGDLPGARCGMYISCLLLDWPVRMWPKCIEVTKPLFYKRIDMPAKILIVDDEVHLARILQFTLEHAGYEVSTAFDGKEAIEKARKERPDLVVLDLMLPIIDGYKVCNILKNEDEFKQVPIIILSARDLSREELDEPIGADLFLEKPFNSNMLIDKIGELLS